MLCLNTTYQSCYHGFRLSIHGHQRVNPTHSSFVLKPRESWGQITMKSTKNQHPTLSHDHFLLVPPRHQIISLVHSITCGQIARKCLRSTVPTAATPLNATTCSVAWPLYMNVNMNRATSRTVDFCACSLRSVSTQDIVKFTTAINEMTPVLEKYEDRQTIKWLHCVMMPLTSTGESHPAPH